jgi:hypothetical protein
VDSQDFWRVASPPLTREQTDAAMTRVLRWIGDHSPPDYVYTREQLEVWARSAGFSTQLDAQQVCALLRRVQPKLVAYDPLAREVRDAIVAYDRYTNPVA